MAYSVAKSVSPPRRRAPRPSGSWTFCDRSVGRKAHQLGRARVELFRAERLGQKIIGAELHGAGVLLLLARGGEDDARNVSPPVIAPHRAQHVEAAQMR